MKVLIISLPRTGSSSLLTRISEDRNLQPIFEPFGGSKQYHYNSTDDNVVVKTIIHQHPPYIHSKSRLDWLIELSKEFDEIILLSRKDITQIYQSYAYFLYYTNKGFNSLSEYRWEMTPNYNEVVDFINSMTRDIQFISNSMNIPITYYEDIYNTHSSDRLRKFPDASKKLL